LLWERIGFWICDTVVGIKPRWAFFTGQSIFEGNVANGCSPPRGFCLCPLLSNTAAQPRSVSPLRTRGQSHSRELICPAILSGQRLTGIGITPDTMFGIFLGMLKILQLCCFFSGFLEKRRRYLSKRLAFPQWREKGFTSWGLKIFCGNKNFVFSQSLGRYFNQR